MPAAPFPLFSVYVHFALVVSLLLPARKSPDATKESQIYTVGKLLMLDFKHNEVCKMIKSTNCLVKEVTGKASEGNLTGSFAPNLATART